MHAAGRAPRAPAAYHTEATCVRACLRSIGRWTAATACSSRARVSGSRSRAEAAPRGDMTTGALRCVSEGVRERVRESAA